MKWGSLLEDSIRLLWFLDRLPGVCLIETDAHGVFTHFGPGAEAFFACPAEEALGKLRYTHFHDPAELEACRDDPRFRAAMRDPGWTEDLWRVIPRAGDPFQARVTLVPRRDADGEPQGWVALYRRIE